MIRFVQEKEKSKAKNMHAWEKLKKQKKQNFRNFMKNLSDALKEKKQAMRRKLLHIIMNILQKKTSIFLPR